MTLNCFAVSVGDLKFGLCFASDSASEHPCAAGQSARELLEGQTNSVDTYCRGFQM